MRCARALSEFVKFFLGDVDARMHAHQLRTQAGLARAHQLDERMFTLELAALNLFGFQLALVLSRRRDQRKEEPGSEKEEDSRPKFGPNKQRSHPAALPPDMRKGSAFPEALF